LPQQIEAVSLRQRNVQQNKVWEIGMQRKKALLGGRRGGDSVAFSLNS
jgi:hypothetical protein